MFRLLKMIVRVKVSVLLSVAVGLLVAGWLRLRDEHRTWGVRPVDVERGLVGDDLVADAGIVETRSLVVDAPPDAVWPWLVQMGYGRAGWYSYDRLDIKGRSAETILPEYQDLKVDDVVPTHPGGGFVARVVDRPRALALYLDSALVQRQMTEAAAVPGDAAGPGPTPAGLQMAGTMGDLAMPEFRASWAFILEPEGEGRTRLIERFRVWTADAGFPQRLGLPLVGYGVFAMTRKHMLGIKQRAEHGGSNGWGADTPATDGPAAPPTSGSAARSHGGEQ